MCQKKNFHFAVAESFYNNLEPASGVDTYSDKGAS